jgi:hypothetical protein
MDLIGGITSGQLGTILAHKGFKKVKNNEYFDYYEPCVGMDRQCKKSFDFTTITLPSSNTLLKWGIVNRIMNELFEEDTFNNYLAVFYHFDTIFPAGHYKGKTLIEVLEVDIEYIEKCILDVDYFFFFESRLSPKSDKIEKDNFYKKKKIFESFSAETREFYIKKVKTKAFFHNYDPYGDYEPPVMPNETYDYEDWLRDECGDEAGSAHWNID